ncbi:hypothetical protein, partial [Clavibacter michiganensis]|uniref:hypothetical protein n=1 Tax=Clavibacter michiganensis TaxID=28447 RepID=UPI00292CCF50
MIRARELLTEDEAAVRAALADRDGDGTAGTAHTADDDTAPVPCVAALVADRAAERALVDRLIALGTARERTAAEA